MTRKIPPTASVATVVAGAKLHSPAAGRNADALLRLLREHAPKSGEALEIASGTGQHVIRFARDFRGLEWQPTDVDSDRLASIDAYVTDADLPNVLPARFLDATTPGWAPSQHPKDLVILVNLLHLISAEEARCLIDETARALSPDGLFVLYGPFKRGETLISDADSRFDAELRSSDPAIGYKRDEDVVAWCRAAGLSNVVATDMPSNNLAFLVRPA